MPALPRFQLQLKLTRCTGFSIALSVLLFLPLLLAAAGLSSDSSLPRSEYLGGEQFLRAFAPVSAATRDSIVKLNVNGETVALGTVVDSQGLVLTKASELKKGKLTCWLASDQEVPAELLKVDDEEDVALVRVHAPGLKPIQWARDPVTIGEWAITPGIAITPHAVGIISALPRRIRPRRAYIGIQFDFGTSLPLIQEVLPGFGAETAGLKAGDLILSVNNRAVTNRDQLRDMILEFQAGQTLHLRLRRDAEQVQADVLLMGWPGQSINQLGAQVSRRAEGFDQAIEHDTVLQPWLCGGPLVNLDGKAVGINIARASRVTTYALPAALLQQLLEKLRASVP
ncbi:MAG: S1C family serine protease [Limisphaerales bacterium]